PVGQGERRARLEHVRGPQDERHLRLPGAPRGDLGPEGERREVLGLHGRSMRRRQTNACITWTFVELVPTCTESLLTAMLSSLMLARLPLTSVMSPLTTNLTSRT